VALVVDDLLRKDSCGKQKIEVIMRFGLSI
jgi:hypothetical protein